MKKISTFLLNTIKGLARLVASLMLFLVTASVWCGAISLSLKVLDHNLWFAVLVFPCGLLLLGLTGVGYQGAMSWINPGWEGVEGGYDGLHYECEPNDL